MARPGNYRPLIYAGITLGLGLGAIFEALVFRQIFQLHGFVSRIESMATVEGMRQNLFWGGIFQGLSWAVVLAGLRLLWRCGRRGDVPWRGRALVGSFLLGWGLYVCVEGMLLHHVFKLHHLVEGSENPWRMYWDIAFLAWGAIFLGVGGEFIRKDRDAFMHHKKQWKASNQRPLTAVPGGPSPSRGDLRL